MMTRNNRMPAYRRRLARGDIVLAVPMHRDRLIAHLRNTGMLASHEEPTRDQMAAITAWLLNRTLAEGGNA